MVGMRTTAIAVAALAASGALLTGCTTGGTAEPPSESAAPQPSALAGFDPCTVFEPGQLEALGVAEPAEPVDQGVGEPGCDFDAEGFDVRVYKAPGNGIDYWEERRDQFAEFERNTVGSREGIRGMASGFQGGGICRQIMAAGDGTVSVEVTMDESPNDPGIPCVKAMEIAQQIEPKLPQ